MELDAKHEVAESSKSNDVPDDVSISAEEDFVRKPKPRPVRNFYGMGFTSTIIVAMLIFLQGRDNINVDENSVVLINFKQMIYSPFKEELKLPQAHHWNFSSRSFYPIVSNWDQQRATWIARHPNMRQDDGRRPWVMMVTGSSPQPCEPTHSHLLIRAGKNKLDYTRIHGMELYYSFRNPYMGFRDSWVKLPIIRMLMLKHPEVEWFWWLNTDAVVTNMSFEFPFSDFDNYNLVLSEGDYVRYNSSSGTVGSFTGAFLIRNCQWSLDLLSTWAYTGTANFAWRVPRNESWAHFAVRGMPANRSIDFRGDDQLSLLALLVDDMSRPIEEQSWLSKVKLVADGGNFANGSWSTVGPELEELNPEAVPFVTHFADCLPYCVANFSQGLAGSANCVKQLERAFDFADNQVYQKFGFLPRAVGNESQLLTSSYAGNDTLSDDQDFRMQPVVDNWDEKRRVIMKGKKMYEAMLLSGTAPKACEWKEGSHTILRGFKNLIDYGRMQGIKVFYNMAVINKEMKGWWSKLPLVRTLMLHHPDVEWFWWVDSDAMFTNMDFRIPLERYDAHGYNFVCYGDEGLLLDMKSFMAINAGVYLIRNCQWSLNFIDRWASFGATQEIQAKNGKFMGEFLSNRTSDWAADDQTALVYMLITEWDTWSSKVHLERDLTLSGDWRYWTPFFLDEFRLRQSDRPLLTHFAGCNACTRRFVENVQDGSCQSTINKAFNFADNEILQSYGLCHERLNSSLVTSSCPDSETERTLEFLQEHLSVDSPWVSAVENDTVIVNTTMGNQVSANKSSSNEDIKDDLVAAEFHPPQELNSTTTETSETLDPFQQTLNGAAKEEVRVKTEAIPVNETSARLESSELSTAEGPSKAKLETEKQSWSRESPPDRKRSSLYAKTWANTVGRFDLGRDSCRDEELPRTPCRAGLN